MVKFDVTKNYLSTKQTPYLTILEISESTLTMFVHKNVPLRHKTLSIRQSNSSEFKGP